MDSEYIYESQMSQTTQVMDSRGEDLIHSETNISIDLLHIFGAVDLCSRQRCYNTRDDAYYLEDFVLLLVVVYHRHACLVEGDWRVVR